MSLATAHRHSRTSNIPGPRADRPTSSARCPTTGSPPQGDEGETARKVVSRLRPLRLNSILDHGVGCPDRAVDDHTPPVKNRGAGPGRRGSCAMLT
jgi:hypothetical protein